MSIKCTKKQVQNTNTSSITSKLSASKRGYFQDDFLKFFVTKPRDRSAIINRGYHIRAVAVENAVKNCIKDVNQVIVLGAGFDTVFFNLRKNGHLKEGSKFVEIDFEPVMREKLNIISRNKELYDSVPGFSERVCTQESDNIVLSSKEYSLLAADLCDLGSLKNVLDKLEVSFQSPTLFIMECVLNYLPTDEADRLVEWIPRYFPNCILVMYDQVCPADGFGMIMCQHFKNIGTPLGSIHRYPLPCDQIKRFQDLNWHRVSATDMSSLYKSLDDKKVLSLDSLDQFDEFEELDLIGRHYCLLTAACGSLVHLVAATQRNPSKCADAKILQPEISDESLKRFGHDSLFLDDSTVAITGGFGIDEDLQHRRLKGVTLLNLRDLRLTTMQLDDSSNLIGDRIFHQMGKTSKYQLLLFGGRGSPSKPSDHDILTFNRTSTSNVWMVDKLVAEGSRPSTRWRHSMVVTEDFCFVYGGRNSKNMALDDAYLLDLKTKRWKQLQDGKPGRHSHVCVLWKDNIVVSGGRNTEPLGLIEMYNLKDDSWNTLQIRPQLKTRYSHSAHLLTADRLLLLGGLVEESATVTVVSLTSLDSTNYRLPMQTPMPLLFNKHKSVVVEDSDLSVKVIVFGGGGNCFSFGTNFDPTFSLTMSR